MDPIVADHFRCDLSIAQKTVDARVSVRKIQGATTPWEKWSGFDNELALNPLLKSIGGKISKLQVFV